jgi:hypothetical protein
MDKHLFPSYIIAGAAVKFSGLGENYLGEPKGILGIDISSTYRNAKFRLEILANEIAEPTTYTFTLPHEKRRQVFYVFPNINYLYEKLEKIDHAQPVNVTFALYINDKLESEQTETVTVHSLNDCPFYIVNPDESLVDMNWMYAAYVDETNPLIEDVLGEGLKTGLVDQFTDYQMSSADNVDEVWRQVIAVWTAMYNRKMTYSNAVTPSITPGNSVYCQNVRLFKDALRSSQANCVDGSAVFSSIFRHIGIEPFLVLVPGHCYMGFYLDREKQNYYCLETTAIGNHKLTEENVNADDLKYYLGLFPKDVAAANKGAIINFVYALSYATHAFAADQPNIQKKKLQYMKIDIENARKEFGVIPLRRHDY